MATYVSLSRFTDQGIRNVKESPDRLATFKAMADKMGVTMKVAPLHCGGLRHGQRHRRLR